jgi:hypothetical protein
MYKIMIVIFIKFDKNNIIYFLSEILFVVSTKYKISFCIDPPDCLFNNCVNIDVIYLIN